MRSATALAVTFEDTVAAQKKQIARSIKPVAGIEALPQRIGPKRKVLLIVPPEVDHLDDFQPAEDAIVALVALLLGRLRVLRFGPATAIAGSSREFPHLMV